MDEKSTEDSTKNDEQGASSAPPLPKDVDRSSPPSYEDRTSQEPEEEPAESKTPERTESPTAHPSNPILRYFAWYWHKKRWTIPLTLLIVVGVIAAIPSTRYPILALGLKRSFSVTVIDSKTNTPVTGAMVTLDGKTTMTDNSGKATFVAKVGKRTMNVKKQYYRSATGEVFVGISTAHNTDNVELIATGRQVPVTVINKITGQPLAGAELTVLDTNAKTDAKGMANIVLPVTAPSQTVTISEAGYNNLSANVQVTDQTIAANTFSLVPAGRLYFLSNLSGKIDVVSTDLDGANRKTVLAGTGKEDVNSTALLASRDWKYLALLSNRAGGQYPELFLINTANDQVSTIDEGTDTFTPIGWSDHYFVYRVDHADVSSWQPGQVVLKSFNADTTKLAVIDQSNAQGDQNNYANQSLGAVNIVNDRIVYGFSWSGVSLTGDPSTDVNGKQDSIISVNADGSNRKDLRDITLPASTSYSYMQAVLPNPQTLYIQSAVQSQPAVYYTYQYQNNSVTQSSTVTDSTFSQAQQGQVTYLASPSDKASFWSESRDGKNTLFVGDYSGENGQQIATLSDYSPYGWFTDSYLLVQKNNSELYILPTIGGTALKISDYYKPPRDFPGYGGGYGGL